MIRPKIGRLQLVLMFIRERARLHLEFRNRIIAKGGFDVPADLPAWVRDMHFYEVC